MAPTHVLLHKVPKASGSGPVHRRIPTSCTSGRSTPEECDPTGPGVYAVQGKPPGRLTSWCSWAGWPGWPRYPGGHPGFLLSGRDHPGGLPGDDLPAFYSGAEALVYVSLFEGFGIPIVEAMGCETAVITSDRSSMAEVAGEAALLVDPGSEDPSPRP